MTHTAPGTEARHVNYVRVWIVLIVALLVSLVLATVNLEHVGLLQSPFATHITYRIVS